MAKKMAENFRFFFSPLCSVTNCSYVFCGVICVIIMVAYKALYIVKFVVMTAGQLFSW